MTNGPPKIGLLARPDGDAIPELGRFKPLIEVLSRRGLDVRVVLFSEEAIDQTRDQILQLDGVLVWVDPISDGRDRSRLDPLLREAASQGVWVSTHPDVILQMGTKDVLATTRTMEWGTDCYRYDTSQELAEKLRLRLGAGARVLKQHRGNGGNGVWKVELVKPEASIGPDTLVRVLHAQRQSSLEEMPYATFVARCAMYFSGSGCLIDQPYQPRLSDGMIRCYLVRDRVAGFGHQFVTALLPPPEGTTRIPLPAPRLYYGPDRPEFQAIKARLEGGWVAEMQRLLDIEKEALPALWDADFLYGPKDPSGEDTYVLCEINVSSVSPFPDEALAPLADAVASTLGLVR